MTKSATSKKVLVPLKRLIKNLVLAPSAIFHQLRPGKKVDSKLVFVFSFPRSGTTALASIFTQPSAGLDYHGEFFAFNAWTSGNERLNKYYPFFTIRYHRNFLKQRSKSKMYRYETTTLDPKRTITAWMKIPGVHVFKIFPNQISDIHLEEIIQEFKPTIIFLRRNHLDRIISNKKANQSGKWHHVKTEDQRVDIDSLELDTTREFHETFYKKFKNLAVSTGCAYLDFNYKEVFKEENLRKILILICQPKTLEQVKLIPNTVKQDSTSINQEEFIAKQVRLGVKCAISDYDFEMHEAKNAS
jgi:hypothetical protein